jgi:hypothetical protein
VKHANYLIVIGLAAAFGAVRSASAAAIVPILGPGAFLAPTTITNNFEAGLPNATPANTPQFTFEGTAKLGLAQAWTAGNTPSGRMGLVEDVANEPLRIVFTTPVHEVGMYFGNDDFGRLFYATLELFDAGDVSLGAVQVRSNGNDFADQFIGARSGVAAKSAAIYYERPNAQLLSVYIDDLTVGGLVPEPSGIALAACGILGLATGARIPRARGSRHIL